MFFNITIIKNFNFDYLNKVLDSKKSPRISKVRDDFFYFANFIYLVYSPDLLIARLSITFVYNIFDYSFTMAIFNPSMRIFVSIASQISSKLLEITDIT